MKNKLSLLQLSLAVGLSHLAHASIFTVATGATTATIQSLINQAAAGSGNSVVFSAGNYTITSPITIPCAAGPMSITGPTVPWPGPYAATLTSEINNGW